SDHLKREVANISPGVVWTPSDRFESKFYYTYDHQFQPSLDFGTVNRLTVLANQIDWQNTIKALDNWTITAGMGFQDVGIKRTSGGFTGIDQSQTGVGAYIQSQFEPVERLHLVNSVRYDSYSDYGSAGTWRQGVSYRIPTLETLVHGSVSKSFAPPSAQDLYFPFGANPNLKPETSRGWEAGLEQPLWQEKIKLSATYFHNEIDNFIELDPTFTPQNIPRATTEGVETALKFAPCKEFETRISYTYLTATDDVNLRRLTRRPRHQLNWDVTARPIEKLTITAGIGWTVERQDVAFPPPTFARTNIPIEDYLTLRAAVTYEITSQWQVWVRGENLTDNKYVYVAGFPALRAAVYGGVKFKF
ncbi:MAG TPA: TonB-dependent receptor, partial [Roseimicrobium sp.]|nr:TonB-dependent receptor [Roseimicrobium sp.]